MLPAVFWLEKEFWPKFVAKNLNHVSFSCSTTFWCMEPFWSLEKSIRINTWFLWKDWFWKTCQTTVTNSADDQMPVQLRLTTFRSFVLLNTVQEEQTNGWLVKTPNKSFAVYAGSATEKAEWMGHIRKCVNDLLKHCMYSLFTIHILFDIVSSCFTVCFQMLFFLRSFEQPERSRSMNMPLFGFQIPGLAFACTARPLSSLWSIVA